MKISLTYKFKLWGCPDLNRSHRLPKPEGYQATPQPLYIPVRIFHLIKLNKMGSFSDSVEQGIISANKK